MAQKDITAAVEVAEKARVRGDKYAEFFGFDSEKMVFSFDKKGEPFPRKLDWLQEPQGPAVDSVQWRLPLNVDGIGGPVLLNPGLVVISGTTAIGKSSFVRALATRMPIMRLQAVEPHDDPVETATVRSYASLDSALVDAVLSYYAAALNGAPRMLPAIDSLRAALFETSGPAGEKGIIMPFFTQVTRVSNALARAGMTVMVTVNPMNSDREFEKAFLSKLSASVPTTILLTGMERSRGGMSFRGTFSARPDRSERSFSFSTLGENKSYTAAELVEQIQFDTVPAVFSLDAATRLNGAANRTI